MNIINAMGIFGSLPNQTVEHSKTNHIIALVAGAAAGAIAAVATFFLTGGTPIAAAAASAVGIGVAVIVHRCVLKKLTPQPASHQVLRQTNQYAQQLQQTVQKQETAQSPKAKIAAKNLKERIDPIDKAIEEAKATYNASNERINKMNLNDTEKQNQTVRWLDEHPQPSREAMLEFLKIPEGDIPHLKDFNDQELLDIIKSNSRSEGFKTKASKLMSDVIEETKKHADSLYHSQINTYEDEIRRTLLRETTGLTEPDKKTVLAPYMEKYSHLMPK